MGRVAFLLYTKKLSYSDKQSAVAILLDIYRKLILKVIFIILKNTSSNAGKE